MTDASAEPEPGPGPEGEYSRGPGRRLAIGGLVLAVAAAAVALGVWLGHSSPPAAAPSPEGVPLQDGPDLGPASTTLSGAAVDGITCRTSMEQKSGYHVHVHLTVFVNGRAERIPAGAGIAAPRLAEHLSTGLFVDNDQNGCLYWLHVHANDGIIHVESPVRHTFTLGQFFDIWGQPLGPDQVGPARGNVVAYVNGRRFRGDPRQIPLLAQGVIQLDIGSPAPAFQPMTFNVKGLCGSGAGNCSTSTGA